MKRVYKYIGLILICVASIFGDIATYANNGDIQNQLSLAGNTVISQGDLQFPDFVHIPYDFEIYGDLVVGNNVTITGNIYVHGTAKIGNNVVISQKLTATEISSGNNLYAQSLHSRGGISFIGNTTVSGGLESGGDVYTGSNFQLSGISVINGDMILGIDTTIGGTLYVYGQLLGKENFQFQGEKLKVIGNFRTLKKSSLTGRIYLLAAAGKRSIYTNAIRINYEVNKIKYNGLMGELDPFLDPYLDPETFHYIQKRIWAYDQLIIKQKNQIQANFHRYSATKLHQELQELEELYNSLFTLSERYVSDHNYDQTQWKIVKYLTQIELNNFLAAYK